jgi:ATP-dependent helicase/nuclease subunit A
MHEVFEGIKTEDDIPSAVKRVVIEGKLTEKESIDLGKKIRDIIKSPGVSHWFLPGNEVLTESDIILPSGDIRRPDRVIIRDGKTEIVDFKFGEENQLHARQVQQYVSLLGVMGYSNIRGYLWYVDKNKIISV